MPCAYRIDKDLKSVTSRWTGTATDVDVQRYREDLLNDPEFDRSYDQLIDFSDVTAFRVTLKLIQTVARNRIFGETSRTAIVAPEDVAFGSSRAFQAYSASHVVMVFRDLEEARRWLDLE
jgi:hypothetical protein